MTPKNILKTTILPLALLSAAIVTPVYGNWFNDPVRNINRNVGSAPNPTPQDLGQNRFAFYPLISQSLGEQGTVGLRIALTQSGAVTSAVVERTSGFQRLDDAAVDYAMAHWIFYPTAQDRREGIPSERLVDVTFTLG